MTNYTFKKIFKCIYIKEQKTQILMQYQFYFYIVVKRKTDVVKKSIKVVNTFKADKINVDLSPYVIPKKYTFYSRMSKKISFY